jgi:Mn2+/Fe2+ NRAMP family transporter
MGGSLLVAALLSNPDPAAALRGTFIPSLPQAQGLYSSILVVMALIGAEAGSIGNLCYPYFIREKGWNNLSHLKQQRFDLAVGVASMFAMGALVQMAAAAIIHPMGINVEDADDLVRIFSETQGLVGLIVFGLGLWGATFSTFVGSNTGFALIATDICRTSIPWLRRSAGTTGEEYDTKKDPVYRAFIVYWSILPLYIIFTDVRPVWLVLVVSSMAVILIPLLALSLLKITNDESLMGKYKNGWLTNSVMIILVVIAIYFMFIRAAELWNNLVV